MSYKPHMVKVREDTWLALKAFCSEVMESATKGRRPLPDLQMEGISIDYAIRLLLGEHYATVGRRRKADANRTARGSRRKGKSKGRSAGE